MKKGATRNAWYRIKSVGENHQPGIEHDREENVAPCYDSEREDDGPGGSGDLPPQRKKLAREDTYHPKREETDDKCQPEPAQDSRHLDEEV